jgi:phage pi2 protein 07
MKTVRFRSFVPLMLIFCSTALAQPKSKLDQFRKVLNHKGNEPVYVVISVRDLTSNQKKDVATTIGLLEGAIAIEEDVHERDPKIRKLVQANDSVVFRFQHIDALGNVSFNLYSDADLKKYAKKVNIDSIKQYISKNPAVNTKLRATAKGWETKFDNKAKSFKFKKERMMFVHLLYNEGILTYLGDQSFGGVNYLAY